MSRAKRLAMILPLAVAASGLLAAAPAQAAAAASNDEAQFVTLINHLRSSHGLAELTVDSRLASEARGWAANMSSTGLHHNPDMAAQGPPGWTMLGENVGYGPTVPQLETAFENSPHHYENLVEPKYNAVGIGVVISGNTIWVTEEFMAGPAEQSATPTRPATSSSVAAVRASLPKAAQRVPTESKSPAPSTPPSTAGPTPPPGEPPLAAAPAPPEPPARVLNVILQLEALDGA